MIYLSFQEAIAIAERIRATPDAEMQRAATGLSLQAICSLAILAHQLDDLARAAAEHVARPRDLEAWATLQEHLVRAAYLPLPNSSASQEPGHGQS